MIGGKADLRAIRSEGLQGAYSVEKLLLPNGVDADSIH
jgi:hypothetical protein